MEKKFKKHWLGYYSYPSDFFESIGNALALLGNFFSFEVGIETKSSFGLSKKRKKIESKDTNRT